MDKGGKGREKVRIEWEGLREREIREGLGKG